MDENRGRWQHRTSIYSDTKKHDRKKKSSKPLHDDDSMNYKFRFNEAEKRVLMRLFIKYQARFHELSLKYLRMAWKTLKYHRERMNYQLQRANFVDLRIQTLNTLRCSAVGRRTDEQLEVLMTYCRSMDNISSKLDLSKSSLVDFCQHIRCISLSDDSFIFLQEQTGHDFFVLIKGCVKIFCYQGDEEFPLINHLGKRATSILGLNAKPHYKDLGKHILNLYEGMAFGQTSLLTGKTRDASAVSEGPVDLMVIPKAIFLRCKAKNQDNIKNQGELTQEKHDFLAKLSLLADWPAARVNRFAYKLDRVEFPRNSVIVSKGNLVYKVFLICSGEVAVKMEGTMKINKIIRTKESKKICMDIEVSRGLTGFLVGGYEALQHFQAHRTTVVCVTSVVAYSIDAEDFVRFMSISAENSVKVLESLQLAFEEQESRMMHEVRRQWELREHLAAHCRARPHVSNQSFGHEAALPVPLQQVLRKPTAPAGLQTSRMAYQSMLAWSFDHTITPKSATGVLLDLSTPRGTLGTESLQDRSRSISTSCSKISHQNKQANTEQLRSRCQSDAILPPKDYGQKVSDCVVLPARSISLCGETTCKDALFPVEKQLISCMVSEETEKVFCSGLDKNENTLKNQPNGQDCAITFVQDNAILDSQKPPQNVLLSVMEVAQQALTEKRIKPIKILEAWNTEHVAQANRDNEKTILVCITGEENNKIAKCLETDILDQEKPQLELLNSCVHSARVLPNLIMKAHSETEEKLAQEKSVGQQDCIDVGKWNGNSEPIMTEGNLEKQNPTNQTTTTFQNAQENYNGLFKSSTGKLFEEKHHQLPAVRNASSYLPVSSHHKSDGNKERDKGFFSGSSLFLSKPRSSCFVGVKPNLVPNTKNNSVSRLYCTSPLMHVQNGTGRINNISRISSPYSDFMNLTSCCTFLPPETQASETKHNVSAA